jgi:hypothetical protein
MDNRDSGREDSAAARASGWAGVALAGVAVLGLVLAPSLRLVWIVGLVFAVSTVPYALLSLRPAGTTRANKRPRR